MARLSAKGAIPHLPALAGLALLAIIAYLPILQFPFISDDYTQIAWSRVWGPLSGWTELWNTPGFRFRFTYVELSWLLDRFFGFTPLPFYVVSLILHVFCTWMVYATGLWNRTGFSVALPAAAFFAVYEGHQEAVMWLAASMELLLFLFGVGAFVCWILFLQQRRWTWYAASLVCFSLAVLSKESAVVLPALLALAGLELIPLLPFGLISLIQVALSLGSGGNGRLQDGSFSLAAPFWITLPNSFVRLLFIWGFLAVIVLVLSRRRDYVPLVGTALVWIAVALLPYSFLLYMHRIPSRQTYLASLGLSWIVGAAWTALESRKLAAVVLAVVLLENTGVLWIRKRRLFLERAAPTEELLRILRDNPGPVRLHCFPYPAIIAQKAAESIGRQVDLDPWPQATPNCFALTVGNRLFELRR